MRICAGLFLIAISVNMFIYGISSYGHSKPLRLWSFRRMFYLFTICLWATGLALFGMSMVFVQLQPIANAITGVAVILMIFTPCSTPVFNTNRLLWIVRTIFFAATGASYLLRIL